MMNLVLMVVVVIIKQHMAHAKTQYQYANFSSSLNILNTNMMNLVWMVVVVIIKQHMAHAKTQYQYANFSMDGDGGHH